MINYLRSEWYRLRKNKLVPALLIVTALLIVAADLILVLFDSFDSNFLYANTKFFYSNALAMTIILYLIGYLLSSVLLGKDKQVMKISVASGIKRETIFWGKLWLSVIVYLLVGIILTTTMLLLGENTLVSPHDDVVKNLAISMLNMLPILLSAFILSFLFNLSNMKDALGIVTIFVIYVFSGGVLRYLTDKHSIFDYLYSYSPSGLLEENLFQFMYDDTKLMLANWVIGAFISLIGIIIGLFRFKQADL